MCYNPMEEDVVRAKNQLKAAILFSQDNLSGKTTNLTWAASDVDACWHTASTSWECVCEMIWLGHLSALPHCSRCSLALANRVAYNNFRF